MDGQTTITTAELSHAAGITPKRLRAWVTKGYATPDKAANGRYEWSKEAAEAVLRRSRRLAAIREFMATV